ncbi:MAG: hypothetical protein WAQ53_14020 [Thiofilum sp.]|uniref:hypothetical protein n=1 Tax=Thiofilum sp. TaxID=2212733 RepID=UPI0025D93758|nr:hypothetical protein [Thiofilum sp.]MBK8453870.1 hypothetical protein [Thiofilum sp.]
MQAEIIVQHGQVKFVHPIYLKPDAPMRYQVEIPDEALLEARDWFVDLPVPETLGKVPPAKPGSLQERLNQLLGRLALTRPSSSIGDDEQMLQDALEERYFGR